MTREINIRLNANCAKAVHTGHKFVSGDKGIVFRIAVESMDTVGTTAKIVFKRSNGTSVEADITEENGIYCYTTLGNEFAVVGPVTADVKFYEGEKRLSTCTFVFDVISDTMDGIGAGTGGYSDTLERMKESMEQTESEMLEVKRDMEAYAEAFLGAYPFNPCGAYSETESYTVRDMVTHNDVAWVCYKDCTGATPAMDSDCWMPLAIKVVDAETLDGHEAEYFFQKSGGTINGDVTVKKESGQIAFNFKNGSRHMAIVLTEAGTCGVLDETNKVWLWNSELNGTTKFYGTASGNLPLVGGGTVSKAGRSPVELRSTNSNNATTLYSGQDGTLGELGFIGANNPTFRNTSGANNTLLHTGNKPIGTYAGNGDATQRTIAVGGLNITHSHLLIRNTSYGFALVSTYGGIIIPIGGQPSHDTTLTYANGILTMATTNNVVNKVSENYAYQVL